MNCKINKIDSWWRNKTKGATGAASVYLLSDMRTLFNNCSIGQASDMPDAMVTDQTSAELYEDEVQEQKMIMSTGGKETPDAMFTPSPTFKGRPVLWSASCTSGYMYFLNFKYIGLNVDPDINMVMTSWKDIPNQKPEGLTGSKTFSDFGEASYSPVAEAEAILRKRS